MATNQEKLRIAAARQQHGELTQIIANTETDDVNWWKIREIFRRRKEKILKDMDDPPDANGKRIRKVSRISFV
jgi:hypothetical protein